jgi:tetratricopeptide (TPR) repeat protein
MNSLGSAYYFQRKYAEAAALYAQTMAIRKHVLGAEHSTTLRMMSDLARTYEELNDFTQAEGIYREVLASRLRKDGADSTSAATAQANLGRNLLAQQKFADAEPVLRAALTIRETKLPDGWQTFDTRSLLGGALAGQKKFAEAEPLLVSGYEGMKQREAKIQASSKWHGLHRDADCEIGAAPDQVDGGEGEEERGARGHAIGVRRAETADVRSFHSTVLPWSGIRSLASALCPLPFGVRSQRRHSM